MDTLFQIGETVTWRANNGVWITGPITAIENGILVVQSIGYPGGEGWRVDPKVCTVSYANERR